MNLSPAHIKTLYQHTPYRICLQKLNNGSHFNLRTAKQNFDLGITFGGINSTDDSGCL
jgi:hypothetical protein